MPIRDAKTAEKKMQLLEGLIGAGVWTYDIQTRVVIWSHGLYRLLGLDPKVIVASVDVYDSLVHPDDRLTHAEVVNMAEAGDLAVRRSRIIRPDGHLIWIESKTERQYSREGRLSVLHGIVRDVTDDERVRSENRKLLSINTSITKLTGSDFWRADREGKLLNLANWMKYTGQNAEQLRDYGSLSAVHPDDRDKFLAAWQNGIAHKQRIDLSVRVRRFDGEYLHFRNSVMPVLDANGEIIEWHGMSWITDEVPAAPTTVSLQSSHIRAARALLNITAQDLAKVSKVSFSTVRRVESDISTVKQDSVQQIRTALEQRGVKFLPAPNGNFSVLLSSS